MKTLSNLSKKTLSIVMMTWAIIMLSMVSKVQAQTTCVNSDFSLGDYTNWTGSFGDNNTGVYAPVTGMVIGTVNALPSTTGQQTIITDPTLRDPNTANVLQETPPSGGNSCRLGNDLCSSCVGGNPQGAELDYNYTPTATSCIFTYQYAVVLQDPTGIGHTAAQCPKFFIYVVDSTGTVVDPVCGEYVVTAQEGLPGFTSCMPASTVCSPTENVVWKNWTTVAIDLSGHINKSMKIEFIVLDCSLGGHFGYAYISCSCGSMSLTQQCFGTSDIISAPAGFASYSWSIGSGTAQNDTIHNAVTLNGDTVTCVCTSVTGCDVTLKIPIDIQPLILSASSHPVAICPGASSTLAVVDSTGGVGDTYNWSCGGTASTVVVSPVVTTTYTVSVTSSSGCSGSIQTTVIIKPKPRATIAQDSVICHGGNTGSATVTPTSGTSPFTYLWTPTGQTSQTATGLSSGTYSVLITDSGGCDTTYSVTVLQPTALAASISASTNVSCNGGSDGSATVTQSGGIPTYTYSWSTTPSHQTTVTATGLSAGTYTVTVTDANGCIKTTSVIITQPTLLIANITPSTNVSCYGGSDGTATASPSGGTPSYLYSWNTTPSQTTQIATGLPIGTYTVTVTDANSCSNTATVTITQPTPVVASIIAFTNVKCYGGHTGTATADAIGGTPTYGYQWNSTPPQVTSIATGLPAGTYTVTATDANLCTNTATVTISQPTDIVLSLIAYTNVSCFGYSNGSASVSATGGVPGYTYIWDDGETGQTADSLNPGVHSVTVMDANNCTKTTTVTITQPTQIHMTEVTDSVLCYGQDNGSITVTATGGTLPYASYIWNTGQSGSVASNLHVGTYTCTVTDANGCKDSIRAHVLQPLILTSIVINADTILPCYGLNNGTITIYVVGGTAPFTYYWNTGATGMTINNLSGGTYTDTITDHNGCRNIHTVVVTQPPALFVQIDSIPESCLNSCDGQLTSAVTGGTPFLGAGGSPYYHYLWNTTPPQTTESITGLCEGTYNLTITDSNGCQRIISNYLGVNDSVVAGFSAAPTSGYIPLTVNFLYTGTSSPANNYIWNFGDGTISSLENPTHIYTTADTFSVWLYITNGVCKDSIHIFVYPEIPSLLIVPNVFTPNGDGYNDEFMVKYQNIKTFSCVIFDRWGKKIYEWDDVTKGWDGKTKGGADCADGTYFYILSAEGWDGLKYTDHGTVTLIRH